MRRLGAGIGILVAGLLMLLTVALVMFAQVLPAMVSATLGITLGAFCVNTLRTIDPDLPRDDLEATTEPETHPEAPVDARDITGMAGFTRSICWILAALFAYAALLQLFGARFVVARYALWHFPRALRWTVGGVELVASVALILPWMAKIGAAALMPIMLGAIYTHLFRGQPVVAVLPASLLALLVFVFYEHSELRRHKHSGRTPRAQSQGA